VVSVRFRPLRRFFLFDFPTLGFSSLTNSSFLSFLDSGWVSASMELSRDGREDNVAGRLGVKGGGR